MILPRLEAAVDDERGREDSQQHDGTPHNPGDRGPGFGPKVGPVNG